MKKALPLILVLCSLLLLTLVLCLSLRACGEDANSNQAEHAYLPYIFGQWEQTVLKDPAFRKSPCSTLTINEDGTCVVDAVAGSWAISDMSSERELWLEIYLSGKKELCVWMIRPGLIDVRAADANAFHMDYSWVNHTPYSDENDIVLTADNWQDYFELRTEATWQMPGYEGEEWMLVQSLVLKDEFAQRYLGNDKITVKTEGTVQWFPISLNTTDLSYALGSLLFEEENVECSCNWSVDANEKKYQLMIWSFLVNPEAGNGSEESEQPVGLITDIQDIRILHIQGTIYID